MNDMILHHTERKPVRGSETLACANANLDQEGDVGGQPDQEREYEPCGDGVLGGSTFKDTSYAACDRAGVRPGF